MDVIKQLGIMKHNYLNILCGAAALLLTAVSCQKEGGSSSASIVGNWELTSIETKSAKIGDTPVSVSLSFNSDGTFSMEQLIGVGRSSTYSGTYTLEGDKLSGKYSDGKAWADTYTAAITQETMTLTSSNGKETDTYKRK